MIYVQRHHAHAGRSAQQDPTEFGDTKTEKISILKQIDGIMKDQCFTLGDAVMMRVYLVGDPDMGGKMDFAGMMAAYTQFFGTKDQPNKPARVTMQVAALVAPTLLVEIEVQAARPKMTKTMPKKTDNSVPASPPPC